MLDIIDEKPISIHPKVPEHRPPPHPPIVRPTQSKRNTQREERIKKRRLEASKRNFANFEADTIAQSEAILSRIQANKDRKKPNLGITGKTNQQFPGHRTSPLNKITARKKVIVE